MSGFSSSQDGRRHKRWEIFEYALLVRENDDQPEPSIIVDLSLGGFQIRSKVAYADGEKCLVIITWPGHDSIEIAAEVRHCSYLPQEEMHFVGLRFLPETVDQRVSLVNYIHDRFLADMERLAV